MRISRYFGTLEGQDYEQGAHQLSPNEPEVELDLNLERPEDFAQAAIDELDRFIDRLPQLRTTALAAIAANMKLTPSMANDFWAFHRDELENFAELGHADLVSALRLTRVGLYPDGGGHYETFDFVIDRAASNELLVIEVDRRGAVAYITWES